MRFASIVLLAISCMACSSEVCDCGLADASGAETHKLDVTGIPGASCVADGTRVIVTCGLGNTCRMQSAGTNAVCVPGFVAGAVNCGGGIACEAPCECAVGSSSICDCNGQTTPP